MPEIKFIEIQEWLKLNGIELDIKNNNVKCINAPDDWNEEDLEEELEEE